MLLKEHQKLSWILPEKDISLSLAITHCPGQGKQRPPVLYVHGATFPSNLSVDWSFKGQPSWLENLRAAGLDAWTFDMAGFGESERYPEKGVTYATPPGGANHAAQQILRVIEHILQKTGQESLDLIAHSWGCMAAIIVAGLSPQRIRKLVLFGPIAPRFPPSAQGISSPEIPFPFRLVDAAYQRRRFETDTLQGPALHADELETWLETYLKTDPQAQTRTPAAVQVPAGPSYDIARAWSGTPPYQAETVKAPVFFVTGEYDALCTPSDMAQLELLLTGAASLQKCLIPGGGHLAHLEKCRESLWAAVYGFLDAEEKGKGPQGMR